MADLTKLRRRNSLGAPPPLAEASANLQAPEIAPPAELATPPRSTPEAAASQPVPPPKATIATDPVRPVPVMSGVGQGARRYDARSARRTGRTLQFATRVSPEFDQRLREIAERDRLLLVELLERALAAYEKETGR